jgi:iron complex outermembrane receptor protein
LVGVAAAQALESAPEEAPLSTAQMKKLSMEELMQIEVPTVFGASKHEQKTSEAPASVSIVTQEDIRHYGYRTLADILRSVRGFYVTYDRSYGYIGLRGINRPGDYGGRVLITVDGHRMNDPIFDTSASMGDFLLDVDLIDRVEVIRGPGSSLYGNNALFTVISVITRRGEDVKGVEASGAVASYNTYTGRLTYGNRFTNGLEVLVSGTMLDSAGHEKLHYPEFSDIHGGYAEKLDNEYAKRVFASVSYQDLSLAGGYSDRKKELPTAAFGTLFNTPPAFTDDERAFAELKYRHEFLHEWIVMARLYFDHYQYSAKSAFDAEDPLNPGTVIVNADDTLAQAWGGEAQVSKTLWDKHRLTAGAEFRDDLKLCQANYDVDPPATWVDVDSEADNFGLYVQGEFSIRTNLILNAGMRYDHYLTFGSTLNPRAALIWSPWQATTFKALYGQAYRAPNAFELDYVAPGYKSNPDLQPETVRSYELAWEQTLGRHLRLTTALFYNRADDLITLIEDSDKLWVYRNTDSVDARGVEVELEGTWKAFRGRVSYTFANAVNNATGDLLSNSPEHLAKLNLSAPLWRDRLFAALEVQGMSQRATERNTTTDSFAVVHFTLFSRELIKGLELSASVYNLFDTRYGDPVSVDFTQASIEQDGRTFRAKVTYRF